MYARSPRRAAGLLAAVLLACLFCLPVKGESALPQESLPFELQQSYKKLTEFNPLYTQRFGADPGVMVWEGRVYVYMTNDRIERTASGKVLENSYRLIWSINCISSADLVNWTDHGEIQVAGTFGTAFWAANSWAPCAAHKTIDGKEKFFLYFCNGGNGIGVLCADSPVGPWRDELHKPLINRNVPNCADVLWLFDPAVMVDDDGTGYLAFGGGVPEGKQAAPGTGRIVRLGEDMISLDGDPVTLDVPWLFEDSGINKIGGKYIYSYCSNWQTGGNTLQLTDGAIQYMTADDPMGPYTYAGELFPNEGRFFGLYGNNHHSIAELDGEYYLFYHNRPVEQAMGITGNYRSPQIDRITLGEDGSLQQVKGTMRGVEQRMPLNPREPVSACTMSHEAGIQVQGMGTEARLKTSAGSWIRVTGADFGEGTETLTMSACSEAGCRCYVLLDSLNSEIAAVIDLPLGAECAEVEVPLNASGVRDIYFVFDGEALAASWQVR